VRADNDPCAELGHRESTKYDEIRAWTQVIAATPLIRRVLFYGLRDWVSSSWPNLSYSVLSAKIFIFHRR
jgi:hypothetical protein